MPTIAGTLRDFGLAAFPGNDPIIRFQANQPGITQSGAILSTKDIEVRPDSAGDFSVQLAATENLATGGIWYTVSVTWLDPADNYVHADFLDWRLYIPIRGGNLADLMRKPANPSLVYVGLTPPSYPAPGMKWLEQNPDGTAGTGNLYEWSN